MSLHAPGRGAGIEGDMHDAVVIGGGIAGLAAAWRLRHRDVLLLEAEARVGGRIRSERRDPYWLNFGAHVYGGPGTATGHLLEAVGIEAVPVTGTLTGLAMNGRLLTQGRVETYPFRVPMSWASRWALMRAGWKVRRAVSRYGRVAAPRPGESYWDRQQRIYTFLSDQTFADFVGPLPEDADAFFRPTVSRSAGDPEEVSAGAGVGYFQLVWNRSEGLSRNIIGGGSTFMEVLGSNLGERLLLQARVEEIVPSSEQVTIRFQQRDGPRQIQCRYAVVTTPAPITRRIVTPLPEEVRAALEQIVYGPYVSAAFLTGESDPQPWDGCYAVATPKRSFNVFFNMSSVLRSQESERRPGSSIMVFSPARLARRLLEKDDAEIKSTYLADLDDIFPGFPALVQEAHVQRWPLGLAYCFPGRGRVQDLLTRPLGRLFLAGDYLGTFYTETAVQTAFAAADQILGRLGEPAAEGPS